MLIDYYFYTLNPITDLNRFKPLLREGVFFRIDGQYFCEYFPWHEFGDLSCDDIILQIKNNKSLPSFLKKMISLEKNKDSIRHRSFYNHSLDHFDVCETVKIKINNFNFKKAELFDTKKLRIDINNLFNMNEVIDFWRDLPQNIRSKIEYLEDPCLYHPADWQRLQDEGIPIATDRNNKDNDFYHFEIYKPNIDDCPIGKKDVIYSSYMGHDLGRYHSYLELMQNGNLDLYHGIDTPNLFTDQLSLFNGLNGSLTINKSAIKEIYTFLRNLSWINLI